jgi:hypothetical protein
MPSPLGTPRRGEADRLSEVGLGHPLRSPSAATTDDATPKRALLDSVRRSFIAREV